MCFRTMVAAALLPLLAAAGCQRQSAPAADVWAVVNGQEIHRDEVQKYYSSRLNPQTQSPSQDEALSLTLNIVDELINNDILIQRANKLGLEATDGEVEDKFTEFKSPYTEEEFQRQLKDRGVSVDDLKKDIRRELSVQKLINREVVAKISISDQDVSNFYNENRAQFNVAETQYRLAQIVVTPRKDAQLRNRKNDDATTDVEARRKTAAISQRLTSGADFNQMAMDYSEDPATASSGGDLGFIPESSLNQSDPALKKAVISLKPGQTSEVIQLRDGYRILKLIAKEAPGQRDIADPQVQQSIRDTLRNRKEQLLRAAYLASARDESKVSNYLAQQVMESAGKVPVIVNPVSKASPAGPPAASGTGFLGTDSGSASPSPRGPAALQKTTP
jgi:peptidyl-prolyl cis-trans isomerase SurA